MSWDLVVVNEADNHSYFAFYLFLPSTLLAARLRKNARVSAAIVLKTLTRSCLESVGFGPAQLILGTLRRCCAIF